MSSARSFVITSVHGKACEPFGRYMSEPSKTDKKEHKKPAPMKAAKHAFRAICSDKKYKPKKTGSRACRAAFSITETTRGSKGKTYSYVGSRRKLTCPKVVMRDGQEVKYKYETKVHAV